jgi:hypothetical protein
MDIFTHLNELHAGLQGIMVNMRGKVIAAMRNAMYLLAF